MAHAYMHIHMMCVMYDIRNIAKGPLGLTIGLPALYKGLGQLTSRGFSTHLLIHSCCVVNDNNNRSRTATGGVDRNVE